MGGWKRIGVVLSVIWFLGFGVFMCIGTLQKLDAESARALGYCFDHVGGEDDHKDDAAINAAYEKCLALRWSNHPIKTLSTAGLAILGINLAIIGLGWLIVWGCVLVVPWIRRGFEKGAAPTKAGGEANGLL